MVRGVSGNGAEDTPRLRWPVLVGRLEYTMIAVNLTKSTETQTGNLQHRGVVYCPGRAHKVPS